MHYIKFEVKAVWSLLDQTGVQILGRDLLEFDQYVNTNLLLTPTALREFMKARTRQKALETALSVMISCNIPFDHKSWEFLIENPTWRCNQVPAARHLQVIK